MNKRKKERSSIETEKCKGIQSSSDTKAILKYRFCLLHSFAFEKIRAQGAEEPVEIVHTKRKRALQSTE